MLALIDRTLLPSPASGALPQRADHVHDVLARAERVHAEFKPPAFPEGSPAALFAPIPPQRQAAGAPADARAPEEIVAADAHRLIRVQGVLVGQPGVAMLNGRAVRPGDLIEGFRLVGIHAHGVTLSRDGVEVRLSLDTGP